MNRLTPDVVAKIEKYLDAGKEIHIKKTHSGLKITAASIKTIK